MKTLDTSAISSSAFMPIKQGTLDFVANQQTKDLGEKIIRWYGIMHAIDLDSY